MAQTSDDQLGQWLLIAAYVLLLPVMLLVLAGRVVYKLFDIYWNSASVRERRAKRDTEQLYQQALNMAQQARVMDCRTFFQLVLKKVIGGQKIIPHRTILLVLDDICASLYEAEGLSPSIEPPPFITDNIAAARYRDRLNQYIAKVGHSETFEIMASTIAQSFKNFIEQLPPAALQPTDEVMAELSAEGSVLQFSVPLIDAFREAGQIIEELAIPFYAQKPTSLGLFAGLREQLDRNLCEASGLPFSVHNRASPKVIMPPSFKGEPRQAVSAYLRDTPLQSLFFTEMPFDIPQQTRFEHMHIVAGSGHGKTQTLQYLIARDLELVANGKASVVVIDSQGDLIKTIAGLKLFAEGQSLHGKLCLIDPSDIEYPVALNLFDVGMERIDGYSMLERERLMNSILELYDFVLSALLGAEMTSKQSTVFRYVMRLMLHVPNATIHTFRELMQPGGSEKYREHIQKLEGTAREFFETEFNGKQFEDTKRQVVRRLFTICENRTFERMFSNPRSKLDLFQEMNAGKIILINTAKDLLKQQGTEVFGRFFIAMIANAAQERATLPPEKRMPTFVYVDECQDYLDQNVSIILEQARKQNCGMVLAHQYLGQLQPKLLESFAANTSIKFAGGVSSKDASALSHMLRCEPEFIESQRKGSFAAFVRNYTESAVSLDVPFGYLEDFEKMTDAEQNAVRARMRKQYAVHYKDLEKTSSVPEPEIPPTFTLPDKSTGVEAAKEW